VTDCPGKIGQVTTETIAVSTTVCPITEGTGVPPTSAQVTAKPPKPTGSSGGGDETDSTTTTSVTTTSFTTLTVPKPGTSTTLKASTSGSVRPSSGVSTTSGSPRPSQSVVTAGAARNVVALGVPAVLAAVVLAL
jgi:chitinase